MSIRNQLAPCPPMGWNSYDIFGDVITEQQVKAQADAMAKLLLPSGWNYLVIDCGWYLPKYPDRPSSYEIDSRVDQWGRVIPVEERFPSSTDGAGLKPLANYVHSRGLKFGLHMMRGIPRIAVAKDLPILGSRQKATEVADPSSFCPWSTGMWGLNWSQPGAQEYYNSIFALYAQWEVDFVKMDDMVGYAKPSNGEGREQPAPYYEKDVEAARTAADATRRDIVLSVSPGDFASPRFAPHQKQLVEMVRISADFWDEWPSLKRQFDLCPWYSEHIGGGFWPDADMLPMGMIGLGHIGGSRGPDRKSLFTFHEQQLMMTLWALFRSPLFLGGDMTRLDDETLSLLTNSEVLAVNQFSSHNRQLFRRGDHVAWTANGQGGRKHLALFNLADKHAMISVRLEEVGLSEPQAVRDLWARQDLDRTDTDSVSLVVPPHGSRLISLG